MTDSQTEEVAVPRSFKEAKQLIRRIALILREIARLELRRNKRKANIDALYVGAQVERVARRVAR
ncbi:MAG: hypothetical protein ABJA64_00675, partial [Candidatus Saccharibacteria bacterium]